MIYEKVKFTNSNNVNEIDPDFIYKLKQRVYLGYVFKGVLPLEYSANGNLLSVAFCYEDIDEDNPARKVHNLQSKTVSLTYKKTGKSYLAEHERIIELYVSGGREYIGSIPTSYASDGRLLSVTLIFLEYL